MDYITAREAAEKWNISERLVQKYCSQGRIDGTKKFGASWGIPANADKPSDPRKKNCKKNMKSEKSVSNGCLMPLMNTVFEPGHCLEYIERMEDSPSKKIALAEYRYFSGNPEEAVKEAQLFLTDNDIQLRLSACFIYSYANLSIGQINRARYALGEVKNALASLDDNSPEYLKAAYAFINTAASVLLHLPLPDDIPNAKEFLPLLPPGLKAFALYVQAHYTYLQKDYSKSLGIVETALAVQGETYIIPAIYLHLVAVMDLMSLRKPEQAKEHLLAAWKIAQPDDLIEGFGEHHGLLGGMLEAVIKPGWPEDFKRIIAITYRFSAGWRKVHNPVTGHDVADNLTTTEFAAAMLAARGWTNQEICAHLNVSQNTVKRHLSSAMQKLGISRRKELKKYMLL